MAESKVRYDAKADVLYLVCDEGEIARSIEVSPGITVEFGDADSRLLSSMQHFASTCRASFHIIPEGEVSCAL